MVDVLKGTDNLQQVTDVSNSTTNNILLNSNAKLRLYSANNASYVGLYNDSATGSALLFENLLSGGMRINNQSVSLGTTSGFASAILVLNATAQGFLPPRMTTTQKNAISSPSTGLIVYDTTLNKLCVYTGAAWETITSI